MTDFSASQIELLIVEPAYDLAELVVDDLLLAPVRKLLYLEETVPIYILLRLPATATAAVAEDFAKRLTAVLDITASDDRAVSQPMVRQDSGRDNKDGQMLFSKQLTEQPVVRHNSTQQFIVWRQDCHLPHAKTKTVPSRLSFGVSLVLNEPLPEKDEYMDWPVNSYNLLRPLEHDLSFAKNAPVLMSSRVSRAATSIDAPRKPRKSAKRIFPCTPALSIRIKSYLIPNSERFILTMIVEVADAVNRPVSIQSVAVEVNHATQKPLGSFTYPLQISKGDAITLGFDIDPDRRHHIQTCAASLLIKSSLGSLVLSRWNTTTKLRDPNRASVRSLRESSLSGLSITVSHTLSPGQLHLNLSMHSNTQKQLLIEVRRLPDVPTQSAEIIAMTAMLNVIVMGTCECTFPFIVLKRGRVKVPELRIVDVVTGHVHELRSIEVLA